MRPFRSIALLVSLLLPAAWAARAQDLMSDTWVATDALGRCMPSYEAAGPVKTDKPHVVGIFYITWHTQNLHQIPGPYTDVSRILQEDPEARSNAAHPLWKYGSYHWGEPEAGYFLSQDEWLIRHDLSMLQDAGVDLLILDVTNGVCYWDEWELLLSTMQQMRAEGNQTPSFIFWSYNNKPVEVVKSLYERYYKTGKYRDLWFYWEGKPLLLYNAYPSFDANGSYDAPELSRGPASYPQEIRDFFTLRHMWWGYADWHDQNWVGIEDCWCFGYTMDDPALRWKKPVELASTHGGKVEQMAITPAQHAAGMNGAHMGVGKSWTRQGGEPPLNRQDLPQDGQSGLGLYFQERWDDALEVDPPFLYINDWNEWSAGMFRWEDEWFMGRENNSFLFIDQYNAEFNRTIQPMRGGYSDNYYMQMAQNIRRYKGVRPIPVNKGFHPVRVDGRFRDWEKLEVVYRDTRGDVVHRDADGYAGEHYRDTSGRNDIQDAKVAQSRKGQLAFYVKTGKPITAPAGDDWMRLLIDADQDAATGWYGYDYQVQQGKLSRYENGSWVPVASVRYAVRGNEMELCLPLSLLGLSAPAAGFDFKWTDHSGPLTDIIDLCTHGDTAPNRRFNYRYLFQVR